MAGMIDRLLGFFGGGMPTGVKDERPPAWPTAEEVAMAQKYNLAYGSPTEPFVQPQPTAKMARYDNAEDFINDWNDLGRPASAKMQPMTAGQRDQMAMADLAVKRSALAALGFDPRQFSMAAPEKPFRLTVGGVTGTDSNMAATTGEYPSSVVHEAMHRGMNMLRAAGMLPAYGGAYNNARNPEEAVVRSMMLQRYGEIEKGRGDVADDQVSAAQSMLDYNYNPRYEENLRTLEEIEAAAAKLIAKRKPGGPR